MDSNQSFQSSHQADKSSSHRIRAALPVISLIVLVGLIFVLGGWIVTQGKILKEKKAGELRENQAPVNVVVLNVSPGPMKESINLPGILRPWISLNVVSEVRGKIIAKNVKQGQMVSKGQVLAKIESRDYRNAYASAKAAYRAAKASYDRINVLVKDRLATQSQLDDVLAQLEANQASMDNAALNLERCVIRSPMKGVVDNLPIEIGRFMNTGDPVADLLQVDRLKVEVGIPESDVAAVRRIKNFKIVVDALEGNVYEGKFHFLSKSTDNMAMLYKLEIALDNTDGDLLPDMFARVEIVKKEVSDGIAVPLFALLENEEQNTVFVANGDAAHRRPVTVGIQDGWRLQITDGLQPEDKVIVVGQRSLKDENPINIVRTVNRIEEIEQ
jgi:membrane fusion protein, multidrug efflux system